MVLYRKRLLLCRADRLLGTETFTGYLLDIAANLGQNQGLRGGEMVSQIMPPGSVFHPSQIHAYEVRHPGYESFAIPAYVARPSTPGPFPGLILTHGVHGYEEHMKEVARRFAVLGYTCIVPALYCRDDFLTVVEEEDLLSLYGPRTYLRVCWWLRAVSSSVGGTS